MVSSKGKNTNEFAARASGCCTRSDSRKLSAPLAGGSSGREVKGLATAKITVIWNLLRILIRNLIDYPSWNGRNLEPLRITNANAMTGSSQGIGEVPDFYLWRIPMNYEAFEVIVLKTTDNAALMEFVEFEEQEWIPFSQIEDNGEDLEEGFEGEVYISEWIAKQKGLLQ
jgi:hypothetical protein